MRINELTTRHHMCLMYIIMFRTCDLIHVHVCDQTLSYCIIILSYSAKFSRHLYFVEWPLKKHFVAQCSQNDCLPEATPLIFEQIILIKEQFLCRIANPRNLRKLSPSKMSRYTVYSSTNSIYCHILPLALQVH